MKINEIMENLRKGEKIQCQECKKGFYTTSAKKVSASNEFSCNKCGSVIRISPSIEVK